MWNPRVHILLPVFNRREITRQCISAIKKQDYKNWSLIVIDDGSVDGTSEMVKTEVPSATILKGDGTLWWAGSLQAGLDHLRSLRIAPDDVVLFLNDDQDFDEDLFSQSLTVLEGEDRALFLPKCVDDETLSPIFCGAGINFDRKSLRYQESEDTSKINCLTTRALFGRWKDLEHIGGFRPKLLPHYGSDYEYTIRAKDKGIKLIAGSNIVVKVNQASTGPRLLRTLPSWREKFKVAFSNRYPGNPVRFTIFTWMISPWPHALKNTFSIWTAPIRNRLIPSHRDAEDALTNSRNRRSQMVSRNVQNSEVKAERPRRTRFQMSRKDNTPSPFTEKLEIHSGNDIAREEAPEKVFETIRELT